MHNGMLWFDDSQISLGSKIQKALDYYKNKYGHQADLVLVHPNTLKDQKLDLEGLTIRPYRPVLPGHIWVGIEDKGK